MQKTPILTLTSIATAAIIDNRFVDYDGSLCDVAGAQPMGVSVTDADIGRAFAVDVLGTTIVEAGAAIPLGAKGLTPVKTDANGKAIAQGGVGVIAGYALQAAAGDGSKIEIRLTV